MREFLEESDDSALLVDIDRVRGGCRGKTWHGHDVDIREVRLAAGARFVVMICGDIMTMPGLPATPAANTIDVDEHGRIVGLF